MIIAGIDYSLSSPAISIYDNDNFPTFWDYYIFNLNNTKKYHNEFGNIKIEPFKEYNTQEKRFRYIADWAESILLGFNVKKVILEGYALGSTKGLIFNIAENTSVLKQRLDLNDISFIIPSPSSIKKQFTGKGDAKKELMVDVFEEKFQVQIADIIGSSNKYKSPTNDIVDSIAISLYKE